MTGWVRDLAMGVRLAVGGGRTSLARFVLSAFGIATAVAVLLVAASIGTMTDNRQAREERIATRLDPVAGVAPTLYQPTYQTFRGDHFPTYNVAATGSGSPAPAGLPGLPAPGEMYVSRALADLLRSPEGELLRPRLPERVVGVLDDGLVRRPGDLTAWVGVERAALADSPFVLEVYGFGEDYPRNSLSEDLLTIVLFGVVALLLPVFVFVSAASRIAGAERDRRLAALRLVGADGGQVRRIAAAEVLVSAVAGLVAGVAVFLVARGYADRVDLLGQRVYVADVVPNPWLVVLVLLVVPALSVLTALFALRRTIIEPLGVVRRAGPSRRRLWWRAVMVVLGVLLLTVQFGAQGSDRVLWTVLTGAALVLVGVPVLLPWLVERAVGRFSGGPPSWQLAVRRMQLDSGTSARVVSGVAVVLAAAIAMQTVLFSAKEDLRLPAGAGEPVRPGVVDASVEPALAPVVQRDLASAEGVESAHVVRHATAFDAGSGQPVGVTILDCASVSALGGPADCVDVDVIELVGYSPPIAVAGTRLEWRAYDPDGERYEVTGEWTVPTTPRAGPQQPTTLMHSDLLVTPGALGDDAPEEEGLVTVLAPVSPEVTPDQLEGIRNAVADHRLRTTVFTYDTGPDLTEDQETFLRVRTALYAGALITLLLAGISLLVLALEQIRERRRQLAILTATGVPRAVLARSLLWQVVVPISLGLVVAVATGIGLAAMLVAVTGDGLAVDWSGTAAMCAAAVGVSLLVSAMTLPFLRRATRLTAMRTE